MENILLLSPHYPPRLFPFGPALKAEGYRVLAMGDISWEGLPRALVESVTEYHQMPLHCYAGRGQIDEGRYDALYRCVASMLSRNGRLVAVESFNEFWLPLEARLRQDFNIPGPRPEDLQKLIRKSLMKDLFKRAQVPVVRGELLRDRDHLLAFLLEEHALVAKPDIGVGASDTHKITNAAEAEKFWSERDPLTTYFIETYIGGDDRELLSFDGLTDADGRIAFYTVHPVNEGLLEITQGVPLTYHNLRQAEISDTLIGYGERLLREMHLPKRFFHIEFFRVGKTYFGLEVNIRPPGVLTLDMMNHARGIDLWMEYAHIMRGRVGTIEGIRDEITVYVARLFRYDYRLTHEQVLERFGAAVVHHQPMDSAIMGDYAYLVRVPNHEERRRVIEEITARR